MSCFQTNPQFKALKVFNSLKTPVPLTAAEESVRAQNKKAALEQLLRLKAMFPPQALPEPFGIPPYE
jgi:hypothetical protein